MLLRTLEFTDVVDDLILEFSASYTVLGTSLAELIGQSAFLRPLPGFNSRLWSQSLKAEQSPRGTAGLSLPPAADVIIDLGTNVLPVLPVLQQSGTSALGVSKRCATNTLAGRFASRTSGTSSPGSATGNARSNSVPRVSGTTTPA
jgi:hypothetical protein